jgi:hypothetical protein
MPRWKSTEQVLNLSKDGEVFDENWMNYDSIYQYLPLNPLWNENRLIRFEDVEIWEVIAEWTGLSGIYAAWSPYAHYFIIIDNWTVIAEFWGIEGEKQLHQYMIKNNIPFSLNKIWIEEDNFFNYINLIDNKTIIT